MMNRPWTCVAWLVVACLVVACLATPAAWGQEGEASDDNAGAAVEAESSDGELGQLAWLVGEWGDAEEGFGVSTSVEWAAEGRFLRRVFSVSDAEGVALTGTQVIGWDAAQGRIRSWTFDSEGGFGEAFWTRDGDTWLIKKTFTLATGEKASAVNVLTRVGEDAVEWQSLNRQRGGELLPSIPPIRVVRSNTAGEPLPSDEEQAVQQ